MKVMFQRQVSRVTNNSHCQMTFSGQKLSVPLMTPRLFIELSFHPFMLWLLVLCSITVLTIYYAASTFATAASTSAEKASSLKNNLPPRPNLPAKLGSSERNFLCPAALCRRCCRWSI